MKIFRTKITALLLFFAVVFSFSPISTQALTYDEIVRSQQGSVLGTSTTTITANPNPVKICDGSASTTITITANAPVNYDVRINSPTGDLFARQAANTQITQATGNWVTNGMIFYVTDTATSAALGSTTVTFTTQGCVNTLTATPNPIQVCSGTLGTTTINANAAVNYDVRVDSPTGTLFAQQAANTPITKATGNWVTNGMKFYLVATVTQNVLATLTVNSTTAGCPASISLNPTPVKSCFSNTATTTITAWAPVDYEVHIGSPTGDLFAKKLANEQLSQASGNWVTNGMQFYIIDSISKATLTSTSATLSSGNCDFSNQPSQFNNLKSVTWYEAGIPYTSSLLNLSTQLPKIKQAGFNTIWLVTPWNELNPKPLNNPPVYNDTNFNVLKQTLNDLRAQNMQAIIGLNYLGSDWSPEGIDYCNWITNPTQYQAFVNYASEFLKRLDGYEDMVNILVFTENAEPCNLNAYSNAAQIAGYLRSTLGNLPNQLPGALRAKFKIGYHDYNLLNLGWAQGSSPIATPNPFDFVSMVAYDLETKTNDEIKTEINLRASRFKALYPNTPLMLGEFGARSCSADQDSNQSRVDTAIIQTAQANKYGFNLWGWKPAVADECSKQTSGYGYAITNSNGSPKPAATAIANLLGGNISALPTTTSNTNPTTPTATSTPITVNPTTTTATTGNLTIPSTQQNPAVSNTNPASFPYPSASLVNDNGTIYFISGQNKIPFSNWQAFTGLGYSQRNVENGNLSAYTLSSGYVISTANAVHPWGSWLSYKGTIYYSHETGLIGVPSWDIFLKNGGKTKYIVRANKYDVEVLNTQALLPILNSNDERVYK